MLEVLTHDVKTRSRSDTSLLADRAVRLQNWHPQPAVVWAIASRDDHGPDVLAGQIEPCHRSRHIDRTWSQGRQDLAVQTYLVDVVVDGIEDVMHPLVSFGYPLGEIITE